MLSRARNYHRKNRGIITALYGLRVGYLVIINLSGKPLSLPSDEDPKLWPPRITTVAGTRVNLIAVGCSSFRVRSLVRHWSFWISEGEGGPGLSLAVVRDLREARVPAGPDELLAFETDVLAGFVLARAAAGLSG